jgi:hypothetical protein
MTPDSARLWRIPPEADLHHREWEGEHVFFHGAAALVLLRLMTTPSDESSLASLLAEAAEVAQNEANTALTGILDELAKREFAEPAA